MPGKDTNIGAKRAREARRELGLEDEGPLDCLLTLVESRVGIPVVFWPMPAGIDGCCWREGSGTVLWVNLAQPAVRQRFTLAHELGHLRCGHVGDVPVETFETLGGATTDAREVQANAFAAELLAPAAAVRAAVGREPTLDEVVEIAAGHGMSTIAALYRLNTLGLTRRYAQLKREIDEGLHRAVWDRLAPEELDDVVGEIAATRLPRVSPLLADTTLAALANGAASVDDAAARVGCDPERLASGLELLRG